MTLTEELAEWAAALRYEDIPETVRRYAISQVLSQLAAARAGLQHPLGAKIVKAFGSPSQTDPVRKAYVLAALTTSLDFDDTMYAGHVSHSTVNVPLAYLGTGRLTGPDAGKRLLTAIVAANETAARVTAAATLGPMRGQTALHAHLVGGVAALMHLDDAPAEQWVNAWGVALAAPPWSLRPAFMGSEAKTLLAAEAVRTALNASAAAASGITGAPDILEHPDGLLARFADVALPDAVTLGLGERWHTESLSFKVFPGCAYLDGAVDAAVALSPQLGRTASAAPADRRHLVQEIDEVVVRVPLFAAAMNAESAAFLDGPRTGVPALNFTVEYNVATALLTGGLTSADLAPPLSADAARWQLAEKVRVEHDLTLTERSVLATAPLGEALRQAGGRAEPWLRSVGGEPAVALLEAAGPPCRDFSTAVKSMGARVEVRLADGRTLDADVEVPTGAAGPETRVTHQELMRHKFLGVGGQPAVADALARLPELTATELSKAIKAALAVPDRGTR
jgi:2-methylcitrate dehydratase PrpD